MNTPALATAHGLRMGMAWRAVRDALARWVAHERDFGRLVLWLPVWGVAGIWMAVALPFQPAAWWFAALAAAALTVRAVAVRLPGVATLAAPSAVLAACLVGALAVTVQATHFGTALLDRPMSAELAGRIVTSERLSPGRQRIVVRLTQASVPQPWPERVRLTVRGGPDLPVGATVTGKARLFPLRGPVMPGGYDAGRRLFFDRIGASGFTYGPPQVSAPEKASLGGTIHAIRHAIAARIHAAMPERTAAFASAVLVGKRGLMDEADVEALRASGLGHILAISGLHMALVAGSVFAAVRLLLAAVPRIALAHPIRKWAAVAGLVAATLYLALSGGSVATQRAYIMLVVALIAVLADRPALTMRTVAIAAMVCLALDPISALEPSFQMSFLAVIALVGAYEWWSARRATRPRRSDRRPTPALAFMTGLLSTSLIAGLATGPPSAFHFHRLAPLGLLANGLAMPAFSLVAMPAGVVALALMPLGLEAIPLTVMDHALRVVLWVAHQAADWSGHSGAIGTIPGPAAVLMAFGIIWMALMTAPWRVAGLAAIAAGLVLAPTAPRPDVLVADDGALIAVRGADGQYAFVGRTNSFAAEIWRKADADNRPEKALRPPQCDGFGCTLPLADGQVAVSTSLRGAVEDCAMADVVVTRHALEACPGAFVIDRTMLRQSGSIGLTRSDAGWTLHTAWPSGPVRRWQVHPVIERP